MDAVTTTEVTPKHRFNGRRGQLRMVPLTPVEDKLARAQARGWNDVRDGKGFRDDYDLWSRKEQWAYERGRQQATLAKAARRRPLTIWNRHETVWEPLQRAVSTARAVSILEECAAMARREKRRNRRAS